MLARVAVGGTFWGRPIVVGALLALVAVPPFALAMALRPWIMPWIDRVVGGSWSAPGVSVGGLAWVWVELTWGVALVGLATSEALRQVDPVWRDAARLVGASRSATWRNVVYPLVRPAAARSAGLVFALALVEPGAPLVLGIRRSLAFQIVEAATLRQPGNTARGACLALGAAALALFGRLLIQWWGGPSHLKPPGSDDRSQEPGRSVVPGHRAAASVLVLGTAMVLAWLPFVPMLARLDPVRLVDPLVIRAISNSLGLALFAVALAWLLIVTTVDGSTHGRARPPRLRSGWSDAMPPLTLAMGGLVLGPVFGLVADWIDPGSLGGPPVLRIISRGAAVLAGWFDPVRSPGVALVLVLAGLRLGSLARVDGFDPTRDEPLQARREAAILLGASPGQARRIAGGGWLRVPIPALILSGALAASSLGPPLLLAPTLTTRPIASAALILSDQPDDGAAQSAALAFVGLGLNLAALGLAARRRSIRLGSWFWG